MLRVKVKEILVIPFLPENVFPIYSTVENVIIQFWLQRAWSGHISPIFDYVYEFYNRNLYHSGMGTLRVLTRYPAIPIVIQ
jgi:hypothetical protein